MTTPTITIDAIESYISELKAQRIAIIEKHRREVLTLDTERDNKLRDNQVILSKLGVSENEIPFVVAKNSKQRKYSKLSDEDFKNALISFMGKEALPTSKIINQFNVSFIDFKIFARRNTDFLIPEGEKKGRTWEINKSYLTSAT